MGYNFVHDIMGLSSFV